MELLVHLADCGRGASLNGRCHLVYALAPPGTSAREANDRVNEYAADRSRRLAVWHDHFVGQHRGPSSSTSAATRRARSSPSRGPLAGGRLSVHPLTYSLTAVALAALTSFMLERYRDVSLDELAAAEPDDPRYWWRSTR